MTFNYQFELCSLLILTCLTLQFLSMKRFPTKTNRLFLFIMFACLADMAFNLLGCYVLTPASTSPLWVKELVNTLFFIFQVLIPVLMYSYVIYAAEVSYSSKPWLMAALIPAAIVTGLILVNPLTHHIFSITMENGVGIYARGPFMPAMYINEFFYLVAVIVLIVIYRNRLSFKQKETIILFAIITGSLSVLQILLSDILLSGMAMTVSIILMDVILQNPEDMLDSSSRLFNNAALKIYLNATLSRSKAIYVTVVEIDGLEVLDRGNGVQAGTSLESSIGKFLTRVSGADAWIFRLTKSRFFIFSRTKDNMDKLCSKVLERFHSSWKIGNLNIDLVARVLSIYTNTSIRFSGSEILTIIEEYLDNDKTLNNQTSSLTIDSTLLAKLRRQHIIEESMRRSVKNGDGLYLCFQPIIDLKNSAFISAEALLRYNDPNLGAISPVEFIPVVEKCGMASYIDTFVINKGCQFLSAHPEVNLLHINLSATEFFHNPAAAITEIVEKNGVNPNRICLEITESSAATHPDLLFEFMTQMSEKGFHFALDDYGTGFANVLQVLKLPFRTIKLDRTLLSDNAKCRAFLESAIKLFKGLGLEPVIEGVETNEQLEIVTSFGASTIQGFLFSPPLVEADFMRFTQNNHGKKA